MTRRDRSNALVEEHDFVESVREGLQFISYYHPADYLRALGEAYEREENAAAKDAIAQILVNSRMAALGKRPLCQDTGTVNVFIEVGMNVRFATDRALDELINEAVEGAYTDDDNPLRASILSDPIFDRRNTGTNAPAVIHYDIVPGNHVRVRLAAKGGGSENKARFAALNPSDSVADWVVHAVSTLGAGWCPPGVVGLGVGGSPEKSMLLAKQALLADIDMPTLLRSGPSTPEEALRVELYERINALGIGAQGLGGVTTVVDVKIKTHPTHAASLPVSLIPQCAANRHVEFVLDGTGPASFRPPKATDWPEVALARSGSSGRRVNLDVLSREEVASWQAGDMLLLSGRILTGRDAAHARIAGLLAKGDPLPVDFRNRALYYVGPVTAVRDEVVGPAGPTTSSRMDKFSRMMLDDLGLLVMIGKAERGDETIELIREHGAAYLIAVGGAAYLVSQAIKGSRTVAFGDLGMEAIHEFTIEDMPVTVAVDASGRSIHKVGPRAWRRPFGGGPDLAAERPA